MFKRNFKVFDWFFFKYLTGYRIPQHKTPFLKKSLVNHLTLEFSCVPFVYT